MNSTMNSTMKNTLPVPTPANSPGTSASWRPSTTWTRSGTAPRTGADRTDAFNPERFDAGEWAAHARHAAMREVGGPRRQAGGSGVQARERILPLADRDHRLRDQPLSVRRRFGAPLAARAGVGSVLEVPLPGPREVDHVVGAERIAEGERVRAYVVEARVAGAWRAVAEGSASVTRRLAASRRLPATRSGSVLPAR